MELFKNVSKASGKQYNFNRRKSSQREKITWMGGNFTTKQSSHTGRKFSEQEKTLFLK